jgi:putative acetyltransferase
MTIRLAANEADYTMARNLFREYVDWLGVDLSFQNFEGELAGLPGAYAPPTGRLLIAGDSDQDGAGCVALRLLDGDTCEMKRLYVRAGHRGTGLGRRLVLAVIEEARAMGYRRMRLDTLERLTVAQKLYESLGFREIGEYGSHPVPRSKFYELSLDPR